MQVIFWNDTLQTSLYLIADVSDIKIVVNYDYPNSSEDYVHRIGRTARAENTGTAYTFFTTDNMKQAQDLVNVLEEAGQQVPPKLYQFVEMAKGYAGRVRSMNLTFLLKSEMSLTLYKYCIHIAN